MPPSPRDEYYVLMWNFLSPMFTSGQEQADLAVRRFRELSCNGATLASSYVDCPGYEALYQRIGLGKFQFPKPADADYRYRQNNLPFYVMNLCPAVYMKWEQGKPLFRAQYEAFARGGCRPEDRKLFVRTPCINNPDVRSACIERVGRVVEELTPMHDLALLWDWRDELSVTSFILAADTCFCEHCMKAMRNWLPDRYADLSGLNEQWATNYASWQDVEPITTLEALALRERGEWNFSPWADHRDFMNHSLASFLADLKAEIGRHLPDALSGPTGTQCPSVFGGYDFSKLAPISDWVEAYDFGQSADLWRSFKPRRAFPIIKTDFARGPTAVAEAMLWTYAFQAGGYSGTIIWESNSLIDIESADLAPTAHARERAKLYAELREGLPRLLQLCDEISSPVAVHYSHASVNADFITGVPNRVKSIAAWQPEHYLAFQCRNAWFKLLEDRGLRPVFIDSRQIEAGELLARRVKLLVMPRSIAVSDQEARQITRFAESGGVVVADSFAGRMDAHCRQRTTGVLDELFGVRRTCTDNYHSSKQRSSLGWEAPAGGRPKWGQGECRAECAAIEECIEPTGTSTVMGCSEYSDTPLGFRAARGKGQAILFNAAPLDYEHARHGADGGSEFHDFFGRVIDLAHVSPLAEVLEAATGRRLAGWRIWAFASGDARYFGVAPDLAVSQDILGAISGKVGSVGRAVRIRLSAHGHIYESRTGRYLGYGEEVADELHATAARLYAVLPYRVEEVRLTVSGGVANAQVRLGRDAATKPGLHVLRFDVLDADSAPMLDRGANVMAAGGLARWQPERPLPAGSRIACRDIASGVTAVADFLI